MATPSQGGAAPDPLRREHAGAGPSCPGAGPSVARNRLCIHRGLSFRGSAHRTLPDHRVQRATEESAFRFLVAGRDAPHWPCPAILPPRRWCGLPRPASREPIVDSSARQPAAQSADCGVAGPRSDGPVFIPQGAWSVAGLGKPGACVRNSGTRTRSQSVFKNPCARARLSFRRRRHTAPSARTKSCAPTEKSTVCCWCPAAPLRHWPCPPVS